MTVNVMVEQDGVETRVQLSDEAWAALLTAAEVGLDVGDDVVMFSSEAMDEAWTAARELGGAR